jgi:hypothetical protein
MSARTSDAIVKM